MLFTSWMLIIISLYFPPPADLNIICFPFQDPLHCLQLLNFSRMIKKCQSYFCLGFYKLDRWPFVWKLLFFFFCFGINFSNFKDHVYSNLIIATKSRDVNFESIFLKFKLLWLKIQNTSFNARYFINDLTRYRLRKKYLLKVGIIHGSNEIFCI